MSWIEVNWSLVRYSPVEGTHYFYDPGYPTAIQFLLNGRWEPWDVGWVKARAQDPDVRQIAQDAEARLIHDQASGYRPWPQTPPTSQARPSTDGHVPSQHTGNVPLPSANREPSTPISHRHHHSHPQSPTSIPPTSPQSAGFQIPPHLSQPRPYTSPYASQPAPTPPHTNYPPLQSPAHRTEVPHPSTNNGSSRHVSTPLEPSVQDIPASPLPLATNRDTKILLSLDGDGIRGLSTVLLIESLVNAICSRIGRRVDPYQIFDLIGGVSTTGAIAILIGRLRMRVHRAREAYVDLAKTMFKDKLNFFVSLDPHAPPPEPGTQTLENGIKELVGKESDNIDELFFDQRSDSTNVFVISTKVEIGSNQPAIIRSYPTRRMAGPELDADLTTWQAMHATLVAPRYINPPDGGKRRAVISPGLVDYGTAKNSPIRDLYYECRKLYSYTNDTMVVVSIGTGSGFNRTREINEMANAVEDRTAEAKIVGDKFETDHRNLIEQGWMKYFRFNVAGLEDVPLEEWNQIDRVKEKTHAYLGNPDVGARFYACVDAICGVLVGDQAAWPRV